MPKLLSGLLAPPVSYQGEYNTGTYWKWSVNNGRPVVTFRQRIGAVQIGYINETGAYWYTNIKTTTAAAGTVNCGGAYFVFGAHQVYTPDMMLQLAEMFSKYMFTKLCFEYIPRAGTSQSLALTWAYSDDPTYPASHAFGTFGAPLTGSPYAPVEQQLASMEGGKQYPVWEPLACLKVDQHLDRKTWYYVGNPFFDDHIPLNLSGAGVTSSDVRQSSCGALFISGSENTFVPAGGTTTTYVSTTVGTLFMSGSMELDEFNPPMSQDLPTLALRKCCAHQGKKKFTYCPMCGERYGEKKEGGTSEGEAQDDNVVEVPLAVITNPMPKFPKGTRVPIKRGAG